MRTRWEGDMVGASPPRAACTSGDLRRPQRENPQVGLQWTAYTTANHGAGDGSSPMEAEEGRRTVTGNPVDEEP
jgi:hypothetical protein